MNAHETIPVTGGWEAELPRELLEADISCSFGPTFFIRHLRAFLRDRCPDPSEALPSVQIHVADGAILDVCHIIGLARHWLAVAVIETARAVTAPAMRTEIVPYALISRITVRPVRPEAGHAGFEEGRGPHLLARGDAPEDMFLAMAGLARAEGAPEPDPTETEPPRSNQRTAKT